MHYLYDTPDVAIVDEHGKRSLKHTSIFQRRPFERILFSAATAKKYTELLKTLEINFINTLKFGFTNRFQDRTETINFFFFRKSYFIINLLL